MAEQDTLVVLAEEIATVFEPLEEEVRVRTRVDGRMSITLTAYCPACHRFPAIHNLLSNLGSEGASGKELCVRSERWRY